MNLHRKLPLILFLFISLTIIPVSLFAQSETPDKLNQPANCEFIKHALDDSIIAADEKKDSRVIYIFFLGERDSRRNLTKRRMNTVRTFLRGRSIQLEQFVFAESERREGLGGLEIYVEGKLWWTLAFDTNKHDCVEQVL